MANNLEIRSPRLRIAAELAEKGNLVELEKLLDEVLINGGPLMEPTFDENKTLVTFCGKVLRIPEMFLYYSLQLQRREHSTM